MSWRSSFASAGVELDSFFAAQVAIASARLIRSSMVCPTHLMDTENHTRVGRVSDQALITSLGRWVVAAAEALST